METVDPEAFYFALSKVDDGFIFENFVNCFLSDILGYSFIPVGKLKDRGIDGLEHIFCGDSYEQYIFQSSIDKNCVRKLELSLQKLKGNKIKFKKFYFITNKIFPKKDKAIEKFFEKYRIPIFIFDIMWLKSRINNSTGTINAYITYILSYLHEFEKPGKSYFFGNLVSDPRLFVFLRQQWDEYQDDKNVEELLADTLILYCLEGTDPDKGIVKSEEEINECISKLIKFDPKSLFGVIDKRLKLLSTKPRRIKYHAKLNGYLLPYKTRLRIQERNLKDYALYENFKIQVKERLKKYLRHLHINVNDCFSLIEGIINKLFYKQGLEFSDFMLRQGSQDALEKNLPEIISIAVDESSVIMKNKEEVKSLVLMTVRDMVYNGTQEQKLFLKKLSNTYMILFLLQCDPKICTFFRSMASKLNIYVGNSILVPSLSEFFLEPINRNHCNLLKKAKSAGATLIINQTILNELIAHLQIIKNKYELYYKDNEDFFLGDEMLIFYIDEIMIRSYFYAKNRGKIKTFNDFLNEFVTPTLINAESDLLELLKEEFGIKFISDESLAVQINKEDEKHLYEKLKWLKKSEMRAKKDANFVLTLYAIRDKNNEFDSAGIFGYKTWWLSKDTLTQKAVRDIFKNKYKVSCYMRPDFLYNYISLAPQKEHVDDVYREMFPSLLGVNVSYHLPQEIPDIIHGQIKKHGERNRARVKATLRDLADRLKSDPSLRNKVKVKHFLDQELADLISSKN